MGGTCPTHVVLCIGIAVAALVGPGPKQAEAQSGRGAPVPASASTQEKARKLVDQGIAAYEARDYDKAIALYLKAFSLVPHPILLFNVAQAHRLAGQPDKAVPFYERYLTLEPDGAEAATARAYLSESKVLIGRLAPVDATATGRLKLRSTPDGVNVMLDGVSIGTTPIERDVAAGAHSITLVEGERLVGARRVEVGAGAVVEVTMAVERPRESGDRSSRLVPVLCWVGGGLALAGSGVAFYFGQQGGPDHPDDKYRYPGASATGFTLAGVGAAAIGVGVWLWVRGSRESAPVAAIGPAGGHLGWSGRF